MPIYSAAQIYYFARLAGFSPDKATTMTAIALSESGGDSHAHNPHGEDSRGLWQINLRAHGDWASGLNLYDPIVNARAAFQVSNGGADVSAWTSTHGGRNASYLDYRDEAQAAAAAHGDSSQLGVWTGTEGYGHPLAAGHDGAAGVHSTLFEQDGPTHAETGDHHNALNTFVDAALAQTGDRYVFGAEAAPDNPDPHAFDCSELTQWAAHRAGVDLPDGSWQQYLTLQRQHAVIPVEQAIKTRGALLFSFSSEPTPGGGRPAHAHVAISLGNGHTIEARGSRYGVGSFDANSHRFQYGAMLPGITDAGDSSQVPPDHELDHPLAGVHGAHDVNDSDHDGIADPVEKALGTDPHSMDTDHDGLPDSSELILLHTDPRAGDTDHDHILDPVELALHSSPTDPTSGEEQLRDAIERLLAPHPDMGSHGDVPAGDPQDQAGSGLTDLLDHSLTAGQQPLAAGEADVHLLHGDLHGDLGEAHH
jgi:cell wall-associated NlpC family hydrolase